ncbi:unnamed protein product [Durusdinium trenchii]|uniref:Uncharacterized protein n=1 Tax=Durusdinium trenchii TaxID=1381693 RepID=A0ABP0RZ18_9DINO
MLAGFKVDVSHQEQERILSEVEAWYLCAKEQAGVEWLPLEGIKNFLFMDLGYEDEAEFEDAIHGSFEDSLGFWGRRPGIESQQGGRHAAREFERLRDEGRTHLPGPCRGVYLSLSCDSGCPFTTHGVSWSVFRLRSRCWVHPSLQADARPAKPLVTWKRFRTGRDTENTVAERDPTVLLFLKNRMLL